MGDVIGFPQPDDDDISVLDRIIENCKKRAKLLPPPDFPISENVRAIVKKPKSAARLEVEVTNVIQFKCRQTASRDNKPEPVA